MAKHGVSPPPSSLSARMPSSDFDRGTNVTELDGPMKKGGRGKDKASPLTNGNLDETRSSYIVEKVISYNLNSKKRRVKKA
jgi:hypothetical protein